MRILITGAGGFVGPYLIEALRTACGDVPILATSKDPLAHPDIGPIEGLDITDKAAVERALLRFRPTHVVHLAGLAAPASALNDPEAAWLLHVHGTLNVARTILGHAPDGHLINVGSGLVYGESARAGVLLDEDTLLRPVDDYAVTKAAADLALGALCLQGLKCIRLRPFNHAGPGQTDAFVISAFAGQIARIEAGLAPPVLRVGNLEARRDFLDVRDVASAYACAVRHSGEVAPGAIFNIASGVPRRIGDVLQQLLSLSAEPISIVHDPQRSRRSDLPIIAGDSARARRALQWRPAIAFEDTLAAVLAHHRAQVRR